MMRLARRALRLVTFSLSLAMPLDALAWTHHLEADLGVQGLMRYCKYSNGKIYTVNAVEICQISIEDSAPGFGQGQGFLKGEYQDGMTKVCIYEVLGERKALRVGGTSICPLNPRF